MGKISDLLKYIFLLKPDTQLRMSKSLVGHFW